MDRVEDNIRKLLDGRALDNCQDLCDFSLEEQNEATVGALVNENDEILMMQEAKSSCAGKWYLPAGRIEPGEDIVDGVKREVLEETGLEMEPTTLLMVECASGAWFRFVVTGNVTGGCLKTPKDADSESLQAKWVKDPAELNLRANDIYTIIQKAKSYQARNNEPWHNCEIFGADLPAHKPHGILTVEHCGKPEKANDGLCFTLLVSFRKPLEEVGIIDKYTWLEISKQLGDELLERLPKNMTVPLNVIR
ncbi:hypothetical protein C0J52_16683 [Blattella germanica]|nr:hypothetical protein C0J52_16683 [Blattella germanica]